MYNWKNMLVITLNVFELVDVSKNFLLFQDKWGKIEKL